MGTLIRCFAFFAAALPASLALAQEPARPRAPTLEERVAALESSVATLDTRLGLTRSRAGDDAGQTELALSGRIQALERTVDRLSVDLQHVRDAVTVVASLCDFGTELEVYSKTWGERGADV